MPSHYESMQHAVYETERAMWAVFREDRLPWVELTADEKQKYGIMLLALTVADRWMDREDNRDHRV